MKKVMIPDPSNNVGEDETVIEPETDLLEEDGSPTFSKGEKLEVRFPDSPFFTVGTVTRVIEDEFGTLVLARIDWNTLKPL